MIILKARWLLVGLLWLTFGMGAASGAPVSDEPPPSPAEAASDADRGSPELAQTLPSFGALDPAHVAEIHDAARKGNVEKIQSLININAGLVNAKDSQGNTPLIRAAETGHKDVAELLLANNADVNAKDSKGWSPLIWAAANGHAAVVQVLLDSGAEENAKTKSGRTPLHVAAERGHKAVVELLLVNEADPNITDGSGGTPLMLAARKGHRDVAELLLTHKADLTARDNYGFTAFHMAANRGHAAMVELLLANQANVADTTQDEWASTPLHLAAQAEFSTPANYREVANVLLAHGARIALHQ